MKIKYLGQYSSENGQKLAIWGSNFQPFLVVFVLFEILELFEYLMAKYSIFEVQLFLLELETLAMTYVYAYYILH